MFKYILRMLKLMRIVNDVIIFKRQPFDITLKFIRHMFEYPWYICNCVQISGLYHKYIISYTFLNDRELNCTKIKWKPCKYSYRKYSVSHIFSVLSNLWVWFLLLLKIIVSHVLVCNIYYCFVYLRQLFK